MYMVNVSLGSHRIFSLWERDDETTEQAVDLSYWNSLNLNSESEKLK